MMFSKLNVLKVSSLSSKGNYMSKHKDSASVFFVITPFFSPNLNDNYIKQ